MVANINVNFNEVGIPVRAEASDLDFDQTLFLGASVMSFSASVGWNQQQSELTVQLVDDDCEATSFRPKEFWDSSLIRRTTTDADIGFMGKDTNIIGIPVFFRVADFEFSGLVQSWTENKSTAGNPIYTVKIVDPREVLEGAQIIINDYAGSVGSNFNLFNAFGFMEQFGINCPLFSQSSPTVYNPGDAGVDGAVFGTPAGGYAGSGANENGTQWNKLRTAINYLINTVPKNVNQFSPYGRVLFRGTTGSGYGVMNSDFLGRSEYFVDLSELPSTPSWWRLSGTNVTLLDAINQVTEESGYDYYIELIPIRGVSTLIAASGVAKIIKIRTVSRVAQPTTNHIADFIAGNEVIQSTAGRELRNDVTSAFIVGGPKTTFYQAGDSLDPEDDGTNTISQGGEKVTDDDCPEIDDMILPYFGTNPSTGDFIVPCRTDDENDPNNGNWEFSADTTVINTQMDRLTLRNPIKITENELLVALGGLDELISYWSALHEAKERDANRVISELAEDVNTQWSVEVGKNIQGIVGIILNFELLDNNDGERVAARDIVRPRFGAVINAIATSGLFAQDLERIHSWLLEYAEMYGKKFAVRIPFTCIKQDGESGQIITSETPSQDGWTEFSTVLGLPNPGITIDFFRNDSQKIESFVRYDNFVRAGNDPDDDNQFNISEFSVDDYITLVDDDDNTNVYFRSDVESEFVYHDVSTFFAPRVIVTLPNRVKFMSDVPNRGEELTTNFIQFLVRDVFQGGNQPINNMDKVVKNIAGKMSFGIMPFPMAIPNRVGFGLQSNINTYGPWSKVGIPGKTRVEVDDGLVPWEYSSVSSMNTAGQGMANQSLTNMQVGEMGSITTHGYPEIPLGAELGAVAGGFFGGGHHLVENRSLSEDTESNDDFDGNTINANYGFFSYSGNWSGLFGPNITSITVSVGSQGVTTEYQLRTFTPKHGRFAKQNADRFKRVAQFRMRAQRELSQRLLQQTINKNILRLKDQAQKIKKEQQAAQEKASPHEVLVGNEIDAVGPNATVLSRTIVASESVIDILNELDEYTVDESGPGEPIKSMMSLDGLFRPTTTEADLAKTFSTIDNTNEYRMMSHTTPGPIWSQAAAPCDNGIASENLINSSDTGISYNKEITYPYLLPFTNPSGLNEGDTNVNAGSIVARNRTQTPIVGHDIDMLARAANSANPDPSIQYPSGLIIPVAGRGNSFEGDYKDSYHPMVLRGPLMMKGWGYNIHGRPVPNADDDEGGTMEFANNFLRRPDLWKSGPIDLRWDENRGVWTSPPEARVSMAKVCKDQINDSVANRVDLLIPCQIIPDTNVAIGDNPGGDAQQTYNRESDGGQVVNPMVYAFNRTGGIYCSGDIVLLRYESSVPNYYIMDAPYRPMSKSTNNSIILSAAAATDSISFDELLWGEGLVASGEHCGALQVSCEKLQSYAGGSTSISLVTSVNFGASSVETVTLTFDDCGRLLTDIE